MDSTPNPSPSESSAALIQKATEVISRVQNFEARLVTREQEERAKYPYVDTPRLLEALAKEAKVEDEGRRADLHALEATAGTVVSALEAEANQAKRLPGATEAVVGTRAETVSTLQQARLLDLVEEQSAVQFLARLSPSGLEAWLAQADDERDRGRLRVIEALILDENWRPAEATPETVMVVHRIRQQLEQRREQRVPGDLRQAIEDAKRVERDARKWRLVLASVPGFDASHVADVLRRKQQAEVGR